MKFLTNKCTSTYIVCVPVFFFFFYIFFSPRRTSRNSTAATKKKYLQTSLHCVCFEMICSDRGVCSKLSNQHLSLELKSTSSLFIVQYNEYILRCGHVHTYYTIIKIFTASIKNKNTTRNIQHSQWLLYFHVAIRFAYLNFL